jgi:uncharacterized repeat protein (TIGR03803 family)
LSPWLDARLGSLIITKRNREFPKDGVILAGGRQRPKWNLEPREEIMRKLEHTLKTGGALLVLAAFAAGQTPPPKLKTLYSFQGYPSDGFQPQTGVRFGAGGVLYGVTYAGGTGSCAGTDGCGTIFSATPPLSPGGAWKETVLYSFQDSIDGAYPQANIVFGAGDVLYTTTSQFQAAGYGTVNSLTPPASPGGAWSETALYDFAGGSGGQTPAGLVIGKRGEMYGIAAHGGTSGDGTVFSLTPPASPGGAWTEADLHIFTGYPSDGNWPQGVVIDKEGVLYGTTLFGGDGPCAGMFGPSGCGAVFSLRPPDTPGGPWVGRVLHSFGGPPGDGQYPVAGAVIGKGGVLYGTTSQGGTFCAYGCGTVFSLTPPTSPGGSWTEAVLYNFAGGGDGIQPSSGVVIGSGGVLYGTTAQGGTGYCTGVGCGTIFSLTPPASPGGAWTETVLYSFAGGGDGAAPALAPGLTIGSNGLLYGTTSEGGTGPCFYDVPGCGTVFAFKP